MVTSLKLTILNHSLPMYRIALKAGINETRLSRLSTRLFEVKKEEKRALSKILRVPVSRLFSERAETVNE